MRVVVDADEADKYEKSVLTGELRTVSKNLMLAEDSAAKYIKKQRRTVKTAAKLFNENHQLNSKVYLLTLVQIGVILAAGTFQIWSLRRYLKAKNLY